MPITRFPFSSGCYRYPILPLRRCCDSIQCGIKSAMILAFRNWRHKRNRDLEAIFAELKRAAGLELVNGLRRSERGNNAFSLVKAGRRLPERCRKLPEGRRKSPEMSL